MSRKPLIEPTSFEECMRFLHEQREDIRNGIYNIKLEPSWIGRLDLNDLQFLIRHCENTRYIIASYTKEENLLEKLADDYNPQVRQSVARSLNTPPKILGKLSKDSENDVRACVAANPKTPESALRILAMEKGLRETIGNNEGAPADLILRQRGGRWCDLCGRLCDPTDRWFDGNLECHVCKRSYCKKHGQQVVISHGYDYDSDYWERCIDHLKVRNKLGYYKWESFFAGFFAGKPDRTW